jgi:uncharacterized protein involved in oxidation of intracellular sulfur
MKNNVKRRILSMAIIVFALSISLRAQTFRQEQKTESPTSLGIVIYSNDTETVWNALRLANYSKNKGDTVNIFLLGKGVEVEAFINESNDIKEQVEKFLDSDGTILGCGTCLQNRNNNEPQVCKFSSLADLYGLIRENRNVLTF